MCFSHEGKYYKIKDSHIVPRPAPGRKFRIFLGGTSDSTYELAGERGDFEELRRLADGGSRDAADQLVELAGERGDVDELRRLADGGNQDAADVLAELADEGSDDTE